MIKKGKRIGKRLVVGVSHRFELHKYIKSTFENIFRNILLFVRTYLCINVNSLTHIPTANHQKFQTKENSFFLLPSFVFFCYKYYFDIESILWHTKHTPKHRNKNNIESICTTLVQQVPTTPTP